MIDSFQRVVETASSERLEEELIQEYENIQLMHQNEIFLQMQAQTIREDSIQETMRNGFKEVSYNFV